MTVGELKKALEEWPDDTVVYVDLDCEGGNENEITEIHAFKPEWIGELNGVKLE